MRKLVALGLIAAFAAFAWLSLPTIDQGSAPGALRQTAGGSGLVLAIDREKGMVTISHGAMPVLGMPPMTMGYSVNNKAQLAKLQPMQKVEFQVVYNGTDYLITEIK